MHDCLRRGASVHRLGLKFSKRRLLPVRTGLISATMIPVDFDTYERHLRQENPRFLMNGAMDSYNARSRICVASRRFLAELVRLVPLGRR
jgi:hypothetical protein